MAAEDSTAFNAEQHVKDLVALGLPVHQAEEIARKKANIVAKQDGSKRVKKAAPTLEQTPPSTPELFPETPAEAKPRKLVARLPGKPLAPLDSVTERQRNLIEEALQIEQEDAKAANAIGYMARTLAQATLPHLDPKLPPGYLYSRDTGQLTLTVAPTSPKHGIPYGSIPRVIMAWICTEVVRTKDRTLSLGHSQADFLERLQLHNNGRDIARFREQSLRLFKSVISVEYTNDDDGDLSKRLMISDQSHVFWHPKKVNQRSLWDSTLELSERFFNEIISAPVPIDLRVFHALSKSPMAMDIYTWLTYRVFVLNVSGRQEALIPWAGLKLQFGGNYGNDKQGLYNFKLNFKKRLREVLAFYPDASNSIDDTGEHLRLKPCKLHIAHVKTKALTA